MAKLEIGTPEEAENCEYLVCVRVTTPLHFPDNLTGKCCQCGKPVQYRPHAPVTPKRLCMDCYIGTKDLRSADNMITPETAAEVLEVNLKKRMN